MRIGIVGRDDDAIANHTDARARARGHDVVRVAFGAMVSGGAAAFDGDSWLWQGEELEACDGFVVRQYPAMHAILGPTDETASAADWYQRGVLQTERSTFAQSALLAMELQGKPMVNPIGAMAPFEHKPLQLWAFRRAGLPVPDTLVTNFPAAARIFDEAVVSEGGVCITKPVGGGAETLLVDDAVRGKLASIASAPVIFQRRVVGPDVRVTVVGGKVASAVAIDSDTLDYRSGAAYRRGEARYEPIELPEDVAAMSLHAARICHHALSGIDWKRAEDGGWFILEANSAPVYLDIERKTGAPITDAVLDHLEALEKGAG